MSGLRSRFICEVPSSEGTQADVMLIEPNGDEHPVRCLVRPTQTDLFGDPEILEYLRARYTDQVVYKAALAATLHL